MILLAGDIGGTKTNLALYSPEAGLRAPLAEATLPSSDYDDLPALVRAFLSQTEARPTHACFGVAGPVVDGHVSITNLPWSMDESDLEARLGLAPVRLLNDLESIANAIPRLAAEDLHVLNDAQAEETGAIAVVAPGTGLGEAFLTWDGARYAAQPSEGGHVDFAPTNPLQVGLLNYLWERYEHVSYERVCSGLGIPNIYAYLRDSGYATEPAWLADKLSQADDPTPVIVNTALDSDRSCELCMGTLDTFVSILGAKAGNMALNTLATGGVYLGGGIPPRILPALERAHFMRSFYHKGRFSEFLADIPVYVIMNPKVALLGAAAFGLNMQES
jgi:glucokinase